MKATTLNAHQNYDELKQVLNEKLMDKLMNVFINKIMDVFMNVIRINYIYVKSTTVKSLDFKKTLTQTHAFIKITFFTHC